MTTIKIRQIWIYDKCGFVKIKFQNLLFFEKYEKNDFFEKLGLPAKPDCRGNRICSEIFFFGFFLKIEFSTSLYEKKSIYLLTDI
jgi:hypothetical protein